MKLKNNQVLKIKACWNNGKIIFSNIENGEETPCISFIYNTSYIIGKNMQHWEQGKHLYDYKINSPKDVMDFHFRHLLGGPYRNPYNEIVEYVL